LMGRMNFWFLRTKKKKASLQQRNDIQDKNLFFMLLISISFLSFFHLNSSKAFNHKE
jgi:hypothetical protein